jgi:hypothetical protein
MRRDPAPFPEWRLNASAGPHFRWAIHWGRMVKLVESDPHVSVGKQEGNEGASSAATIRRASPIGGCRMARLTQSVKNYWVGRNNGEIQPVGMGS